MNWQYTAGSDLVTPAEDTYRVLFILLIGAITRLRPARAY
jgi:hypothetical protein